MTRSLMAPRRLKGFTLIELMIVLAIVAIITAIAYPSYQSHIQRTRRANAAACLQAANRPPRLSPSRPHPKGPRPAIPDARRFPSIIRVSRRSPGPIPWPTAGAEVLARALELAERALFLTPPKPRVGCVITGADGAVLGEGHTQAPLRACGQWRRR